MKTTENYLEVDVEKTTGIINRRNGEIDGFVCDIEFSCSCGWHGSAWGQFSKGKYSKTCPKCGSKSSYTI